MRLCITHDPTLTPIPFLRVVRILHGALLAGLVLAGAVFFVLLRIQGRPLGAAPSARLILAAVAVALLIVASTVFRRRTPERRFDQAREQYWASAEIRGFSILLWAVVDGAGLVAWMGYVFSGGVAPAAAAVLSIVTLFAFRPSRLEGEGEGT